MDIRIKTFLKLYETMNYHETARQLNMTQPTVTQHIKSLESEYNCRFFIYDRKKLYITKDAKLFESYARSAVYNNEKLCSLLNKPTIQNFRIGATKSIGEYMIKDITTKFLSDLSRTAEITIDNTEHLLRMLDNNRIDFALIEGSFDKTRYASRLFRNEPLCGICAKGSNIAGKTIALENFLSETLIVREPGSGTRGIFDHILCEHGYTKDNFARVITVSEFSLLVDLVANGIGISFVYQTVAKHSPSIDTFLIEGTTSVHELNYVYLKDTLAEALMEEFSKYDSN